MRHFSFITVILGLFLAVQLPPVAAQQGQIMVNTPRMIRADDSLCSLPEAISTALTGQRPYASLGECALGTVILLPGREEYQVTAETLESPQAINAFPVITGTVTIRTVGGRAEIRRAPDPDTPAVRFFEVAEGGSLTLENIDLSGGSRVIGGRNALVICPEGDCSIEESGGAILSYGDLTLNSVLFRYNTAGLFGGALALMGGTVTIHRSSFFENHIFERGRGGAIYLNRADLTLSNGLFQRNSAGNGAALFTNNAEVQIRNSFFLENVATGHCGAIEIETANVSIIDSTFAENQAAEVSVICNRGETTITDSVFSENEANCIANTANLTLQNIIVEGCLAGGIISSGDLVIQDGRIRHNFHQRCGGGIRLINGETEIINTEISDNYQVHLLNLEEDVPAEGSGGGICFDPSDSGTLLIRDSRIFGNFTTGYGGGIYAPAGAIEIINTHIYDNSAQQSGGGVFITTPDYRIYPDVIIEDNQAPEQPDLAIPSP